MGYNLWGRKRVRHDLAAKKQRDKLAQLKPPPSRHVSEQLVTGKISAPEEIQATWEGRAWELEVCAEPQSNNSTFQGAGSS